MGGVGWEETAGDGAGWPEQQVAIQEERFKQEGGKVRISLKDLSSCCVHPLLGWRRPGTQKAAEQK